MTRQNKCPRDVGRPRPAESVQNRRAHAVGSVEAHEYRHLFVQIGTSHVRQTLAGCILIIAELETPSQAPRCDFGRKSQGGARILCAARSLRRLPSIEVVAGRSREKRSLEGKIARNPGTTSDKTTQSRCPRGNAEAHGSGRRSPLQGREAAPRPVARPARTSVR
jgi:hypothetical protein